MDTQTFLMQSNCSAFLVILMRKQSKGVFRMLCKAASVHVCPNPSCGPERVTVAIIIPMTRVVAMGMFKMQQGMGKADS